MSPDEADDAVRGRDALHRVAGLNGEPGATTIAVAMGRLRSLGVTGLRLVLPEPGDLTGLPGPAEVSTAALIAGSAVLTVGPPGSPALALLPTALPSEGGDVVRWDALDVVPSVPPHGLPTLSEGDRLLSEAVREATETLDLLEVARGRDDVAGRLAGLDRELRSLELPASLPARAQRLVVGATRLLVVVTLAAETDGAAVTAGVAAQRSEALRPLRRAARHALCAGWSALADPTAGR